MDIADNVFAPLGSLAEMRQSEHVVQFYESDDYLLESVRSFVAAGLVDGDACLVVATKKHREDLEARLRASGLDMTALSARGQYLVLDSAELLTRFMRDGSPDPELFAQLVGGIVTGLASRSRRVRVFGEMVAQLWAEGEHQAAIQLEGLWNELQKTYAFSLFCGYPLSGFGKEALGELHGHVCGQHSHVIPAESYNSLVDVSDRLRAIAELQQRAESLEAEIAERKAAEAALERSLQLRDEFLASVSHDLRTPLTVLLGQAQILRRRAVRGTLDEDAMLEGLSQIEGRTRWMAALVGELMDVTRLRAGENLSLVRRQVDLVGLARDVVAGCQKMTKSHRITLSTSENKLDGWWDEQRLYRVLENLVSNAIKYSPDGGEIAVCVARENGGTEAIVSIEDHGIGIPAHDLPQIFEPFYRGENVDRRTSGTGLGLTGTHQIVEQHSGTIAVESQEGAGSTFTIRLPINPPADL